MSSNLIVSAIPINSKAVDPLGENMKQLILLLSLMFLSLLSLAQTPNQLKEFSFTSVGNDSAHIDLIFFKNKTFELKFKAVGDEKESSLRGVWLEQKNVYDFTVTDYGAFKKDILDKFFDIPGNKTLIKINDKEAYKLRFNKNEKFLEIWKIQCERKE